MKVSCILLYEDQDQAGREIISAISNSRPSSIQYEIIWFRHQFPNLGGISENHHCPIILKKERMHSLPEKHLINSDGNSIQTLNYPPNGQIEFYQSDFDIAILDIYGTGGDPLVGENYAKWLNAVGFKGVVYLTSAYDLPNDSFSNLAITRLQKDSANKWLDVLDLGISNELQKKNINSYKVNSIFGLERNKALRSYKTHLEENGKENESRKYKFWKSVYVNLNESEKELLQQAFLLEELQSLSLHLNDPETNCQRAISTSIQDSDVLFFRIDSDSESKNDKLTTTVAQNLSQIREALNDKEENGSLPPYIIVFSDRFDSSNYDEIFDSIIESLVILIPRRYLVEKDLDGWIAKVSEELYHSFTEFEDDVNATISKTPLYKSLNSIISNLSGAKINSLQKGGESHKLITKDTYANVEDKLKEFLKIHNCTKLITLIEMSVEGQINSEWFDDFKELIKGEVLEFIGSKLKYKVYIYESQELSKSRSFLNSIIKACFISRSVDRICGNKTQSILPWMSSDYSKHSKLINSSFSKKVTDFMAIVAPSLTDIKLKG